MMLAFTKNELKRFMKDVKTKNRKDDKFFGLSEILENSGYKLLHRPYFAMRGCTHDCYSLNSHIKIGVDAAQIKYKSIAFDEYIELFKDN